VHETETKVDFTIVYLSTGKKDSDYMVPTIVIVVDTGGYAIIDSTVFQGVYVITA
jgi:hypothetical protein